MYHETRSVYSDIHLPEKNNLTSPRPITDVGVRKALKNNRDLASLKVLPADEKLLALIAKNGEWEKNYWKTRLKSSLAWDTDKNEHDQIKLEKMKNHRMQVEILREEDRQTVVTDKLERQKKRLKRKTQLLTEMENDTKRREKAFRKQKRLKEKELKQKIAKEEQLQHKAEENWWDLSSKLFEKRSQDKIEHDKKLLQAAKKKDEIITEEAQKIAKQNEEARIYFTERYVMYEKKLKNSQKALTAQIERRLEITEQNHERIMKEHLKEIQEDVKKEEARIQHAIKTQHKLERRNHKRMMQMLQKTQQGIESATDTLTRAYETIAKQIKTEREEKEKQQRKNMKKLQKEAEKWSKKVKKDIIKEETKMKDKQEERINIIEKTRDVAHGSRILRNKLRDIYGSENFDKKLFRVQQFHSLGSRPSAQSWNRSTISLL